MNQKNKFCTRCGNPINEGDRFCNKCGYDTTSNNYNQTMPINNYPNSMNYYPNNNSYSDNSIYGVLCLILGIVTFFTPGFLYLVNYQLAYNFFTYVILLVLEITGLALGKKCNSKSSAKSIGIAFNILAIITTIIIFVTIILVYGFVSLLG